MPRANRDALAGHVWHLTERCHHQQFLLRFARDRRAWVRWLYESRRRFGLSVLNYQVTSNRVHLLARCLTYIDLNMVRAGVVVHPREWAAAGCHEIQHP